MSIERLYKYGSLGGHSEVLFSEPHIWFSSPSQLNDPFECRPWFTFEGTQEQIVESLVRSLRERNLHLTPDAATANAVSIFLQGRHRDPATWEGLRRDVIRMLGNEIGLCCLSRVPDSILMWSHYGRDHRGYCLEFQATDQTVMFGEAQPVLYSEDFPIVDFYNTPKDKQVDLIFLTKYLGWAYEQEWRVIDHQNGPGLHAYPSELLKGVIFGLRMPESEISQIKEWTRRRDHPVKFYRCTQDDRKFAIGIQEIE